MTGLRLLSQLVRIGREKYPDDADATTELIRAGLVSIDVYVRYRPVLTERGQRYVDQFTTVLEAFCTGVV